MIGPSLRVAVSVALFVLLSGAGVGIAFAVWNRIDEDGEQSAAPAEQPPAETPAEAPTEPEPEPREAVWPLYGFDARRTAAVADSELRPPFRRLWTMRARSLLEFPPVIAYGRLYFGTNAGQVFAVDADSGKVVWRKNLQRCIAAAPAVGDEAVYVSLMDPAPCSQHDETQPGYLVALDADTGKRIWRFKTGVNESSPLLVDGVLYFGTWDRLVYALDARTRRPLWTYETGDRVKGGAAFARGTVFIGSYDGNVYALDASTGEERWVGDAQDGGSFYATPVVAGGRVFIGSTGGTVHAFDVDDGSLAWTRSTDGFVYGSAAVARRTVYVGSYDGRLYALDAVTGEDRWTFDAGGPVSGSPTVLGGIVYFSTLSGRTYGLNARNGKRRWMFRDGEYAPPVADAERLYVSGYSRLYGFEPRR